jgi:hypothetical protein
MRKAFAAITVCPLKMKSENVAMLKFVQIRVFVEFFFNNAVHALRYCAIAVLEFIDSV